MSPTPTPAAVGLVTAADLGATWRPGCPVGPELLRRVEVDYVGFDGQTHRGELVVHQDVVADVIAIFEPGSNEPSLHSSGRAIDVNPLINPYIDSRGNIEPTTAGPYLDRNRTDPGILHAGDPAVHAFTDRGWRWGGDWRTPKDYQHFERG